MPTAKLTERCTAAWFDGRRVRRCAERVPAGIGRCRLHPEGEPITVARPALPERPLPLALQVEQELAAAQHQSRSAKVRRATAADTVPAPSSTPVEPAPPAPLDYVTEKPVGLLQGARLRFTKPQGRANGQPTGKHHKKGK